MNKTTKITLIAIVVIILGFVGYKARASSETKEPAQFKENDYCTTEMQLNRDTFSKCAAQQFAKKFDRIEKEKEDAKKKAETEAKDKMWRAVQNIYETDAQGTGKLSE